MNREEVKQFVREVVGRVEFHDYDKWVSFSCPLSPWLHESGQDRSASAGISLGSGTNIYNCYACKTKGPLSRFLKLYQRHSGRDLGRLVAEVENGEYLGGSLGRWGGEQEEGSTLGEPLDKAVYFDLYEPAWGVTEARRYLRERNITRDTAEELRLLFDPEDSEGDARILFPVCTPNDDLHGFTGRAISKSARLRVRDYHGLKKKLLLLGAQLLHSPRFVVLVEGLFDFANMIEMRYPAVATMKSDLSPEQAEILRGYRAPVYVFYDNDQAGHDGLESVKEHLCKHLPVSKVRYPKVRRIRDAETGEMRPPNDPGELTEAEVESMLRDSRLV